MDGPQEIAAKLLVYIPICDEVSVAIDRLMMPAPVSGSWRSSLRLRYRQPVGTSATKKPVGIVTHRS